MFLSEFNGCAGNAARARRRIRYKGVTPRGHQLWTEAEDDLCRKYGHDYELLRKKIPHRSYRALRQRCQALGLRPKRNLVTANELSRMRRLLPTASPDELRKSFPDRSIRQLRNLQRYYGIKRKPQPFMRTGIPVIDDIRDRCFELRYSMVDLDKMARTKAYFQKGGWHQRVNYRAIGRAIAALDGDLTVRWRDE